MDRLEQLHSSIYDLLESISNPEERRRLTSHIFVVSSLAALLAEKRGLNRELAAVSGLLHDISLISGGKYETHTSQSAMIAEAILTNFSREEIGIITHAIRLHNDLENIDCPYDEVLKDADCLEPYLYDINESPFPPAIPRLNCIMRELGLEALSNITAELDENNSEGGKS